MPTAPPKDLPWTYIFSLFISFLLKIYFNISRESISILIFIYIFPLHLDIPHYHYILYMQLSKYYIQPSCNTNINNIVSILYFLHFHEKIQQYNKWYRVLNCSNSIIFIKTKSGQYLIAFTDFVQRVSQGSPKNLDNKIFVLNVSGKKFKLERELVIAEIVKT